MKFSENSNSTFEQPPVGAHVARCIKLIDLGTQENDYQGKVTHPRQVMITWELPNSVMEEGDAKGKPFIVSKFYTQSLSEKANLRKDLMNWRGRDFTEEELAGFDAKNILGKPCMVSITLTEKGKARVSSVMAIPKGMSCPEQVNPSVILSLEYDEFNQDIFDSLGKGLKNIIEQSPEFKKLSLGDAFIEEAKNEGMIDDDIAF
jgi:hypothetical protein